MDVISQDECNKGYDGTITVTNNHICARGYQNKDKQKGVIETCNGDSGGPLAVVNNDGHYELIGLVSFGSKTCVAEDKYGVTHVCHNIFNG